MMIKLFCLGGVILATLTVSAKDVATTSAERGASGHGANLEGGSAPSLLATNTIRTTDKLSLGRTILNP